MTRPIKHRSAAYARPPPRARPTGDAFAGSPQKPHLWVKRGGIDLEIVAHAPTFHAKAGVGALDLQIGAAALGKIRPLDDKSPCQLRSVVNVAAHGRRPQP